MNYDNCMSRQLNAYLDTLPPPERIYELNVCPHCDSTLSNIYVHDYEDATSKTKPIQGECPYCGETI